MRWNNPPEKPASTICRENLPDLCATITRWILLTGKTRHFNWRFLLAREPPFPAQNPQARPGPPSLPPPAPPPTEEGGGAGSRPGSPTHPEQVLLLSFPFTWMDTYCITASGFGFHQLLAASKKRRKTPNLLKVLEPPAYQVINRCLSPLP